MMLSLSQHQKILVMFRSFDGHLLSWSFWAYQFTSPIFFCKIKRLGSISLRFHLSLVFYDYITPEYLINQSLWTCCSTNLLGWEVSSRWWSPSSDNRIATYVSYLLLHNKFPQKVERGLKQQTLIIS